MKQARVKKATYTKAIVIVMALAMMLVLVNCTKEKPLETPVSDQKTSESSPVEPNAPEVLADEPKEADAPAGDPYALAFTWDTSADCSVCHQKEQDSYAGTTAITLVHNAQGLTCLTCHADSSALSAAHEKATSASKPPTRLRTTKVEQTTCLDCHGSLESLAQASAECTVLTDTEGTVVNPHAVPENNDHAIVVSCVSCHAVHTGETVEVTANGLCLRCHHENVYSCYTCHG